jgi:hypothetical protein
VECKKGAKLEVVDSDYFLLVLGLLVRYHHSCVTDFFHWPDDGGGIRGLSELIILGEIMKRIRSSDGLRLTPRPCDYFDLIGGTGTGGYANIYERWCPYQIVDVNDSPIGVSLRRLQVDRFDAGPAPLDCRRCP